MSRLQSLACLSLALLLGVLALSPAARAARPLQLGFFDPLYTTSTPQSAPWLQRTVAAAADIVRIDTGWLAPTRPASPRDPADPAYDFTRADAAIKAATERGLQVLVSFTGAPAWAEGPGRPANVTPGSWRPDAAAVGDYGAALAARYSGSYPDPAQPAAALPRARAFQVWNEPNLDSYLMPQWSGGRPASPAIYRALLNAFYRGVKSVSPRALVVTAGTAPFGDPPGGARMMPARFWRGVLCQSVRGRRLVAARCGDVAHLDVLSHHPYPGGAPTWKAVNADDVSIADLGKITRIIRAAQRSGRIRSNMGRTRLWVTEISYDSKRPDPYGVPERRHARWLAQTLYMLWHQGVETITWFRIVDSAPVPSYGDSNQSGLYLLDATPKLAARAFRFPFVVQDGRAWGRSPVAGRVTIERRRGARWVPLRRVQVGGHGTFSVRLGTCPRGAALRAVVGRERSLDWQR